MYGNDKYGLFLYANETKEEKQNQECYIDLMHYLPKYWHSIKEMIMLQESLGKEVGQLNCKLKDLFNQCFIETATWGLELWEKELNLQTNKNMLYSHRREIIKAKLRGTATTTKEMIENVASAFSNGEVKVIEHNDRYYFEIKFIGTKGIPSNMQGLKDILEEIKPAHLGIEYSYTFTLWRDVKKLTWADMFNSKKTWDEIRIIE
ncbi:MAG: putative phage tail protein [Peptoanaerobacter stomatis]|uniref:putative phage tail protein n=1 Tax=Peptoanaerobacter stomatis TaxID=796937 RepID=UPI003F9EF6A9